MHYRLIINIIFSTIFVSIIFTYVFISIKIHNYIKNTKKAVYISKKNQIELNHILLNNYTNSNEIIDINKRLTFYFDKNELKITYNDPIYNNHFVNICCNLYFNYSNF